jgi:hypothetical protein
LSFLLCLSLVFNKIRKGSVPGGKRGWGEREGAGGRGRNGPMYAHMNLKKKETPESYLSPSTT